MEVLGAASAIITVIQITAKVVSICYDYQTGTRHYPKKVVNITHELQNLRNILERLADMVQSQDDSNLMALPTLPDMLIDSGGPLDICKGELKQLQAKLAPARGRFEQISRVLVWPLMEKDVQKSLDVLARQRGLLQLALTADQTNMTLEIKNATARNKESLVALDQKFHAMTLETRSEKIVQWLAAPDPSSNHNKACQTKQQQTGRWLLQNLDYIHWKDRRASFLWLHGIPGCGKTVLCSTVVQDIASMCYARVPNILTYYYFDFNDSKKQTYEGLLRSLVTQIFGQCLEIPDTMEALFKGCGEGQREPTCNSLIQALKELLERFEKVYLILDALNECAEIPAVISFIREICGWHNHNLRIFIASRNEFIIEKGFRFLTTAQIQVPKSLVDADIKLLVRERLRSDPELSRWSEAIKIEIEKTLHEGSKGMFLWAVCQLNTLRKCIKPSAVRKALASLPKTLEGTYERILCNIDQDHAEDALKVLIWLAFSARPLVLQEVAEATVITLDDSPSLDPEDRLRDPTDILAICSSLISVSSRSSVLPLESSLGESSTRDYEVRLAHDSVKEYLSSERIKETNAAFYSISEASSNIFLARACLAYLMHFKEPSNDSTDQYLSEYPLLRYSAQEWEFHVTRSGDVNHDHRMAFMLKEFFLSQDHSFANWLDGRFGPYSGDLDQTEEGADGDGNLRLEGRLYCASKLGLLDICKTLLERGVKADPSPKSMTGLVKSLSTPLQISAYMGHDAIVRLLLDHDANVNQRSVHSSPLDYAVTEGRESIVRLLLERGATVTIKAPSSCYGFRGLTTLGLAARAGHTAIVKLVLDHGTHPTPEGPYSEAYREAIARGHRDVADLLLGYEADSDDSGVEYFDVES